MEYLDQDRESDREQKNTNKTLHQLADLEKLAIQSENRMLESRNRARFPSYFSYLQKQGWNGPADLFGPDYGFEHHPRQSAENAVSAFGEVPNAISYIYYILGTNSERILLFAYVVTK